MNEPDHHPLIFESIEYGVGELSGTTKILLVVGLGILALFALLIAHYSG